MCGIAGAVSLDGRALEPGLAAKMRDRILHRGPDGNGDYDAPGVSLAACRLAIVDLDPRGLMPMASANGRYRIVHNGEIYNRLELRDDLIAQGVELRTTTDTEVLLELYAREGARMLDRLDGMFAFAIWDSERRELFAARDRVGEKPLHYALRGGILLFASEPKALFAAGLSPEFDDSTFIELLAFRSSGGERTPYRGVTRLLPAHWLRVTDGRVETGEWWRFPTHGPAPTIDEFGHLFTESVRRRLIADVPVGTFLSGGLDSTTVTALAAQLHDRRIPAFTVRYDGLPVDEGAYSVPAAEMLEVDHHQIRAPGPQQARLVEDATRYLDEPIAFPASPEMLAVSRYASERVRVVLTGETADELFGGYGRMRLLRYPLFVSAVGRTLRPFRSRLRVGSRWHRAASSTIADRAEWIAASYADGDLRRFSSKPLAEWAPYRAQVAAQAVAEHSEPVRQALAYERLTHLPAIVATGDRLTMAAAIETRLPFTDPRLLDFAALARTRDLFEGPHGKQPIRQAAQGKIPDAVLNRRKRGWTSPFVHYVRTVPELGAWLSKVPDHEIVGRSALGRETVRRTIDEFMAGDDRRGRDAWMIGRIVLWHQVCVEGNRRPISGDR